MIAQKIMDAKQSQEPRRPMVSASDLIAVTPWALARKHFGSDLRNSANCVACDGA